MLLWENRLDLGPKWCFCSRNSGSDLIRSDLEINIKSLPPYLKAPKWFNSYMDFNIKNSERRQPKGDQKTS